MRVGILTFHRAHNYGAVLQCYALQRHLLQIGLEVEIVDYRQPFIENVYKPFSWQKFVKVCYRPKALFRYFLAIHDRNVRSKLYNEFCHQHLFLSEVCTGNTVPMDYDAYIIGSDQLWNPFLTGGDDVVYWGDFVGIGKQKLVTYAISTNLQSLKSYPTAVLSRRLRRFYAISAREESIAQYLGMVLGKNVPVVLDPTLLVDSSIWSNLILNHSCPSGCIVFYNARTYHKQPDILLQKARELSKITGLSIIDLNLPSYSPVDFVSIIANAAYVITSSFHAVAFSIIFSRNLFAVKYNDPHDLRYVNLLTCIGASDLLVDVDFMPQPFNFDYSLCHYALDAQRNISKEYLIKALF